MKDIHSVIAVAGAMALSIMPVETYAQLLAGTSGAGAGLVYAYQSGTNWTAISPPLGDAVLDIINFNGTLYAATMSYNLGGEVWQYNGGASWTVIGTNLDEVVCALAIYNGQLYAGTVGTNAGNVYRYNGTNFVYAGTVANFTGIRAMYSSSYGYLQLGDIESDVFGHYDGTNFYFDADFANSCVVDFAEYNNELYAGTEECAYLFGSTNGINWTIALDCPNNAYALWELEPFQGQLYLGYSDGTLAYMDSLNVSHSVLTVSDSIISMVAGGNTTLYFGAGAEAVGDATGSGPGYAYAYTGNGSTNATLISGPMGAGVQCLYYPSDPLLITPAWGFAAGGGVGGPFSITNQSFTLANTGTNSLNWSLLNTSDWLDASPGGGTLAAGGTTNVNVWLNSNAHTLPLGVYTATVWFTNLSDGVGQGRQFTLTVNGPPVLTCPGHMTVTATNQCETVVNYTVTVSGGCAPITTTCVPPSGSVFTNGATTVNCSAMDACGQSNSCSFTVTVSPPPPPVLTCPGHMTVTATNLCQTVVNYPVTVSGGCPPITSNCVPPSGSVFPNGATTVNCSATDACGQSASCSFTVTVTVSPPPPLSITSPGNVTVTACSPETVVNYAVTVSGGCPPITTNYVPPSGSVFPIGASTVNCSATDSCCQSASCSFTVTVALPAGFIDNSTDGLVSYWPLDAINNNQSTPDAQGGYDLVPRAGSSITTFSGAGITLSHSGGCRGTNGYLTLGNQGLLGYQSPQNCWGTPSTPLPPTQFPNYTISLWVKGVLSNMPAGGGDRIFASACSQSPSPVSDLETGGSGGASYDEPTSVLDNFVRQNGGTEFTNSQGTIFANYSGGTHRQINARPWDGKWHNLTLVAQMITNEPQPVIQPIAAPEPPANGSLTITFSSMPLDSLLTNSSIEAPFLTPFGNAVTQANTNQNYILQASTNPAGPWTQVSTNATAVGYGCLSLTDPNATNATAFYRVLQPAGPPGWIYVVQVWSIYMDGQFISSSLQYSNGINGANTEVPVGIPVPGITPQGGSIYLQNTGNMPGGSDPDAIQPPLGIWACDLFAIGGLFRSCGAGSYLPAGTAIDAAAVWKRALSQTEISNYMANGITNPAGAVPLTVTLTEDFPAVAVGDVENLNWTGAANAASFVLQPGNLDVTSDTVSGIGFTNEVITTNITNTITVLCNGLSVTSAPVSVIAVPGVAAGWHYIDSFTYLPNGWINGQGGWDNGPWQNASADIYGNWGNDPSSPGFSSALLNMEVYTGAGTNDIGLANRYASFDGSPQSPGVVGEGGLAGRKLGGDSIPAGGYGTLFFRFYLDPSVNQPDNNNLDGLIPDVDCNVGLTDKALRDPIDFDGFNGDAGPAIFILRNETGFGGPIDLNCTNGPAAMALSPGGYSWVQDTLHNPAGNGLAAGQVYDVWIDFTNCPAEVSGGIGSGAPGHPATQTNGCYYRVWLQAAGGPNAWPNRTNLFEDITATNSALGISYPQGWLVTGRDMATNANLSGNYGAQPPSELLSALFLCTSKQISTEDTNMLRFDDFYLSSCGYNSTLPVPDPAAAAFGPENSY